MTREMTTKYNTDWIMKTAQELFEMMIKFNTHFTMERAINIATQRAQELNATLQDTTCKIDEHGNITRSYDFGNIQSLNSIYGRHSYCGD